MKGWMNEWMNVKDHELMNKGNDEFKGHENNEWMNGWM